MQLHLHLRRQQPRHARRKISPSLQPASCVSGRRPFAPGRCELEERFCHIEHVCLPTPDRETCLPPKAWSWSTLLAALLVFTIWIVNAIQLFQIMDMFSSYTAHTLATKWPVLVSLEVVYGFLAFCSCSGETLDDAIGAIMAVGGMLVVSVLLAFCNAKFWTIESWSQSNNVSDWSALLQIDHRGKMSNSTAFPCILYDETLAFCDAGMRYRLGDSGQVNETSIAFSGVVFGMEVSLENPTESL